jgi:hypothetical protein
MRLEMIRGDLGSGYELFQAGLTPKGFFQTSLAATNSNGPIRFK